MVKIYTEEGLLAFWKGNFTNVVRIFPYSACQLMANDAYKRLLSSGKEELSVSTRLLAGALAGMTASAATHPLDTVRLRLALAVMQLLIDAMLLALPPRLCDRFANPLNI